MSDGNGTALSRIGTVTPQTAASMAVDWPKELEGAKLLLSSGLLPPSIKTAQQALYVILTGRDLGLSPVQSLRSINVIQGKIEVAADMQLALFKRHGGRAQFTALTDAEAVLTLHHANGDAHTETFTMADAQRAGLNGDNWRKYPRAMLRSRVITAGLKSVGFDVLAGAYAEGEIGGPEPAITSDSEPVSPQDKSDVPEAGPSLGDPAAASTPASGDTNGGASAPTEKQVAFFLNLIRSSAISPEEREVGLDWLETKATKDSMKEQIDRLKKKVNDHAAATAHA